MNILSSAKTLIAIEGICPDRLLKQRCALRKPDFNFDFPPPCGGLRSLAVEAGCTATKSRTLSELLSQARQTPSRFV
jgi:hypothetical protein